MTTLSYEGDALMQTDSSLSLPQSSLSRMNGGGGGVGITAPCQFTLLGRQPPRLAPAFALALHPDFGRSTHLPSFSGTFPSSSPGP